MSRKELLAIGLFALATVGAITAILAVESYRRKRVYTPELIARAPEHGGWYPSTIRFPPGEPVRILIRNIDTVTHGFAIPELSIALSEIKAGEVKEIRFAVERPGSYPFKCTVWCSTRHMEMHGELVVE